MWPIKHMISHELSTIVLNTIVNNTVYGLISRSNIFANNAVKACSQKITLHHVLKLIMNCHTLVFVL